MSYVHIFEPTIDKAIGYINEKKIDEAKEELLEIRENEDKINKLLGHLITKCGQFQVMINKTYDESSSEEMLKNLQNAKNALNEIVSTIENVKEKEMKLI